MAFDNFIRMPYGMKLLTLYGAATSILAVMAMAEAHSEQGWSAGSYALFIGAGVAPAATLLSGAVANQQCYHTARLPPRPRVLADFC